MKILEKVLKVYGLFSDKNFVIVRFVDILVVKEIEKKKNKTDNSILMKWFEHTYLIE
jgi:hypothetical protein